jgi:hypothetical protein
MPDDAAFVAADVLLGGANAEVLVMATGLFNGDNILDAPKSREPM